jgi:hypothetical protein
MTHPRITSLVQKPVTPKVAAVKIVMNFETDYMLLSWSKVKVPLKMVAGGN